VLVGLFLYALPGLRLYEALPLAGLLYLAALLALRTFSADELRQLRRAAHEGMARWRGKRGLAPIPAGPPGDQRRR
jgi:hypothetical protein